MPLAIQLNDLLRILRDEGSSPARRAQTLCRLFKQHVHPPIKLTALSELLDHPAWINRDTVQAISHLKGELPVQWNFGQTVIALDVGATGRNSTQVLYLRLSQSLTADEFIDALKAAKPGATHHEISILEVACSPA